jgi:thiol-disulfide isomerase/thioredoxin
MNPVRTCLAALLLMSASSVAQVSTFSYSPQFPKKGEKVTITYDPSGTSLSAEKSIEATAYVMNSDKPAIVAKEVPMVKNGNKFTGTFQLDANSMAAGFSFSGGDKKDNNSKDGYLLQVYNANQQPVDGANLSYASVYENSYIGYLLGVQPQPDLALKYSEKEYNDHPGYRKQSANSYFRALTASKKEEAYPVITKALDEMKAAGNLEEPQYSVIAFWYGRMKMKEQQDAAKKEMKEKFPQGSWVKEERLNAIYAEKDAAKRVELASAFIKDFPATNDNEKGTLNNLRSMIANGYATQKNWEQFSKISPEMNAEGRASLYNNISWNMAEKDDNIEMAKKLSYEATNWAKNEIDHPTATKPDIRTEKQWKQDRKNTYSMYADTYAYIMFKVKDYKTGLTYAKDAVDIGKRKNAEYNERYVTLLEKTAPATQVKKELEIMAKDGALGKEGKEVLKRAYTAVNKSDNGFTEYMAKLDETNIEKMREELKKSMLNDEAPIFRLVNLEGKDVNLSSLKGKVVVLDFWATWCGPCKASFPGMQRTVEKYKDNTDVVFLFIDTWEKGADREKLVTDFIAKNKYTFNVLYDTPKSDNADEFAVVSNYKVDGIPTKFVVDANGQIRFKSVGFGGNEDMLVKEMSMMIEMAGQGGGVGNGKKGF